MTSRRNVLGLLAAAPFVAPAMAKAAATPNATRGVVGLPPLKHMNMMAMAPGETINIWSKVRVDGSKSAARMFAALGDVPKSDTPNRLHGAYINNEGDAV